MESGASNPHSGTHSVFGPEPNEVGDDKLVLRSAIAIPANATSAGLTFWHNYAFEHSDSTFYDGGVLEVSTDGGNTWADAGTNITAGGYNGTISSGFMNPLAGRSAWGGTTSGAYTQVQVNLLPYRGPSLLFRLRLGTDNSGPGAGWYVDDVQVTYTALLPSCSRAWSTVSNYPVAAYGPAVVSRGGLLYSFGGRATGTVITAASYSYNPATNTWSPIASLPSARYSAAAVTDGTYIYILNGADSPATVTHTLWRYDPTTNSYMTLASPTTATSAFGAAYLNGKIYRIAGSIDTSGRNGTSNVEVYDIATNSWSAVANYPEAVLGLAALPLNGYIYTAGGSYDLDLFAKTYRYDPGTNTWDDGPIADLPGANLVWLPGSIIIAGLWLRLITASTLALTQLRGIRQRTFGLAWTT